MPPHAGGPAAKGGAGQGHTGGRGLLRWLWQGRRLVRLGLGLTALLFVISLGASLAHLPGKYRQEAKVRRSALWLSSNAALEAAQFESSLHRYLGGRLDAERLEEQFEVLYSRIILLQSGDGPEEYANMERLHALAPAMLRDLDAMEVALRVLMAGDPAAAGRIELTLARLRDQLHDTNRHLHLEQRRAVDHLLGDLRGLKWLFLFCAVGLLVSVALLILMLALESRRAHRSLTSARAAMARQAEAERTLLALMNSLPAMISVFDPQGRHLFVNEAYARFHGVSEASVIGRRPEALGLPPGDLERLPQALACEGPLPFLERAMTDQGGQQRALLGTAVAVDDGNGAPGRVVFVSLDISDRKMAEERVRHMAEHDVLTGLPNRLLFGERLNRTLAQALAGGDGGFALHGIDIDNFKAVNDSLGHPAGDQLLQAAAMRMLGCLRPGDMLARISGDEFAVIQPGVPDASEARELAARLVRAMAEPFHLEGRPLHSGISVGTVLGPEHGRSAAVLQQRSDIALYRAKAEGRGRAVLFDPAMEEALQERRQLALELAEALRAEALALVYQPKFSIASLGPVGCEALLRWNHPVRGPISPARFVPLAEESGMAEALGRYVLRQACRQIRRWQEEGLEVPVAVNLSANLFAGEQAVRMVAAALEEGGVQPRLLEIELTEGVFIHSAEAAQLALEALHRLGVRVALDDFGTGYSSLGYLQHLPFDVLKVDRTFVRELHPENCNSRWIVDTILRLARGLGVRVVAEGVETAEQLAVLRQLGCDAAQGFLLGRPMPAAEIAVLYRRGAVPRPVELAGRDASCP
ncbi:putative bifunctional diguanylate cyclase/phosphodiesterase [Teichococcus aestuarii]|uniref:putative bifunctional diguanylate cyclase/phosphodiesterase n=1 Tax=Teichococcus aestuarii TaxID=568898 RepID=UPI00360E0D7D